MSFQLALGMINRSFALFPIILFLSLSGTAQPFIQDIHNFAKLDSLRKPPRDPILFIGSSSFTNWKDIQDYFPEHPILNRAFGGSSLPHLLLYAEEVIFRYHPKQIVIYCGENDLAQGYPVNEDSVLVRFQRLHAFIRSKLPAIPIVYLSMKPSPSRINLLPLIQKGNQKIKEYSAKQTQTTYLNVYASMMVSETEINSSLFLSDSLHMNAKGYQLWQQMIEPLLLK